MPMCEGLTKKGSSCGKNVKSGNVCHVHRSLRYGSENLATKSLTAIQPSSSTKSEIHLSEYPKRNLSEIDYEEDDLRKSEHDSKSNYNLEWKHILNEIGYNMQDDFLIKNSEIKDAKKSWNGKRSQFEPRLLCKQDTKEERPFIFRQNNLCILAIENGKYLLTRTNIYYDLSFRINIAPTKIIKDKGCLLLSHGESESLLLDNMRYSGIFEREEFLGEPIEYGPLMRGRHRCSFEMDFGEKKTNVNGVQIETDACYISKNKILLVECKKGSIRNSFNIRQLYYPYRYIYNIYEKKKDIIPVFVYGNKNQIYVWKFKFADYRNMNTMILENLYFYQFV